MSQDVRPFTQFVKEHRPVMGAIGSILDAWEYKIRRLSTVAELDDFVERELPLLLAFKSALPELGGTRVARVEQPEFSKTPAGDRVRATRHWIAVEAVGDPDLFGVWPEDDDGLTPVNSSKWPDSGLTFGVPEVVWQLSLVVEDDSPGTWGLYTYFDLTEAEEKAASAHEIDLSALVAERIARVEPILDRIRKEVDTFFDEELPKRVRGKLAALREEFEAREGVTSSLRFPKEWTLPAPTLEVPAPDKPTDAGPAAPLDVPHTPRLSPVSFEQVQHTMRLWVDAIDRYPRSFSELGEDQISDLLAATLNATVPGAHREVYRRSGKSDIFVQADVLSEGTGPAKVFITETKWSTSHTTVRKALDPQLFSYLTASDTAAVLLILLPQKDKDQAIATYSDVLRGVDGFEQEEHSAVEGWPVFVYRQEGRIVRVCVAWVHLPRGRSKQKTAP